ncbi:MAG TPA: hypothetical protein VFK21_04165 [Gammaproteobacteria bacterium]|nr:hypothetical protein [Gammaproteobacteria bacterium]
MAFLRFLVILCLALAVPALIAVACKAAPAAERPHLIMLPAARIRLHSHSEEQPLALTRSTEQSLG